MCSSRVAGECRISAPGWPVLRYLVDLSRLRMTNDFLRTLIEKADYHGGQFDIQAGNEKWIVTVTKEPS